MSLRRGLVEGKRNLFLFYYATWLRTLTGLNGEALESAVQRFNARFVTPLPPSEVRSTAKSAAQEFVNAATGEVRARRFRTSTVMTTLAITPDEQRRMAVLIGRDERLRRKRSTAEARRRGNGVRSHEAKAQETLQRVREAIIERPGVTSSELARVLGVSRPTIAKYRNQLSLEQTNENL